VREQAQACCTPPLSNVQAGTARLPGAAGVARTERSAAKAGWNSSTQAWLACAACVGALRQRPQQPQRASSARSRTSVPGGAGEKSAGRGA
jgi:hypothetical protein